MVKIYSVSDWKDYQTKDEKIRMEIKSLQGKNDKKSKKRRKYLENELRTKKDNKAIRKDKEFSYVGLTRKKSYDKDLERKEWKTKCSQIRNRDGNKCALCGSTENLNVHHIYYKDGRHAWEYPNSALITLCQKCHQLVHSYNDFHNELNPYSKQNPHYKLLNEA